MFEYSPGFFCPGQIYNLQNIEATNSGTFWSLLRTQLRKEINQPLRKTTLHLCVIPYTMYSLPNIKDIRTRTNLRMRLEQISFCS